MAIREARHRNDKSFRDDEEFDLDLERDGVTPGKRSRIHYDFALDGPPIQAKGLDTGAAAEGKLSAFPTSGGSRLPAGARRHFERAFRTDFSDVRIYEGKAASQLGATAFTHGANIYFAPGRYDPISEGGRELLGHELTHVVQQRAGVATAQGKGGIINRDRSLENEADTLGAAAARGETVEVRGAASVLDGAQRDEDGRPMSDLAADFLRGTAEGQALVLSPTIAKQAAVGAVQDHLAPALRKIAEAAAEAEAKKIAKVVGENKKSRSKSKDGSFKKAMKDVAAAERAHLEAHGDELLAGDSPDRVEKRAYAHGKEAGREAASKAALEITKTIATTVTDDRLSQAMVTVEQALAGAAKDAATAATKRVASSMQTVTEIFFDHGGGSLNPADKLKLVAKMSEDSLVEAMKDTSLLQAAQAQALALGKSQAQKSLKSQIGTSVGATKAANEASVKQSAIAAGTAAAKQVRHEGVAEAGIGKRMTKVANVLEAAIPDAGDQAEIDVEISVPIPAAPGTFINIRMKGSVARAGGAGAASESFVTLKAELMLGVAGSVVFARAVAEMGGYMESCGASAGHALEQISYALYRRFKESDVIPHQLVEKMWHQGASADGSREEASAKDWAAGVEERMLADKDEDGTVKKRAYVETGVKAGVRVEAGTSGMGAKGGVHGFTGRHLRGEGTGDAAAMPSKQTKGIKGLITGKQKERKGRGVNGLNFQASFKAGPVTLGLDVTLKWFEKLDGEDSRQMWVAISGSAKVKGADMGNMAEFIMQAIAAVSAALGKARLAYEKSVKGEKQSGTDARTKGALADTVVTGIDSAASGAAAMATGGFQSAGSAVASLFGSETQLKVNYENRDDEKGTLTINGYQAKKLDIGKKDLIGVGGAKASVTAAKRLFQLTAYPKDKLAFEFAGFDVKGD